MIWPLLAKALVLASLCRADLTAPEVLNYSINWPSGLSLGEATLKASRQGEETWSFELEFQAAVPGFALADRFTSLTNANQCSASFDKDIHHGKRKSRERITFDSQAGIATRETLGGGKSTLQIPPCARDALAFVFYLRRELAQGRIPAAQRVFYGAPYHVKLDFGGVQRIRLGDRFVEADRIQASVKGPASEFSLELFFARDSARTPLLVKLPLSLGLFAMELVGE
ncbi:MAG: DUF3108 domain-containing protein [Bryobacteraceae bacterium]|nr:DUF3108 domain-containing protein [Bryobacteraceae bacterium]MDW8378660.1 DUF3108 domain-containing protein [Bryobacterales bacterium]